MFYIDDEIHILIQRSFSAELSEAEHKKLSAWIEADEEHKSYYEQIQRLLGAVSIPEPEHIPDVEEAWSGLEKRLLEHDNSSKVIPLHDSGSVKSGRIVKFSMAIAATLIIFIVYLTVLNQDDWNRVMTANGERSEIQLADHSTVTINSGSQLAYPDVFTDSVRLVKLEGQAFFDISSAERPFIVETQNARIRVLGTRFDVFARYDRTEVIVEEGKVMLSAVSREYTRHVILQEDQMGIVNPQREALLTREKKADYLIGWLDNRFVFHKTPLEEAVAEMERRHDVSIMINNNVPEHVTMSGSFEDVSVDSTLEAFCLALNLSLTKEGNMYVISR